MPGCIKTQLLRQQDVQLSPPRANQKHRGQARRLQSISNAYNEKHIFFPPQSEKKIISGWTEGSTGRLQQDIVKQITQISISLLCSIGEGFNKVTFKPLNTAAVSFCVCVSVCVIQLFTLCPPLQEEKKNLFFFLCFYVNPNSTREGSEAAKCRRSEQYIFIQLQELMKTPHFQPNLHILVAKKAHFKVSPPGVTSNKDTKENTLKALCC